MELVEPSAHGNEYRHARTVQLCLLDNSSGANHQINHLERAMVHSFELHAAFCCPSGQGKCLRVVSCGVSTLITLCCGFNAPGVGNNFSL